MTNSSTVTSDALSQHYQITLHSHCIRDWTWHCNATETISPTLSKCISSFGTVPAWSPQGLIRCRSKTRLCCGRTITSICFSITHHLRASRKYRRIVTCQQNRCRTTMDACRTACSSLKLHWAITKQNRKKPPIRINWTSSWGDFNSLGIPLG